MCQRGKHDTGKLHSSYIGMNIDTIPYGRYSIYGMNVCGSAYVNGAWSMACVL